LVLNLSLPTISQAGSLDLDLSTLAGIHDLSFKAGARVGIQGRKALSDYSTDQLNHLGCFAKVVDSLDPLSLAILNIGANFSVLDVQLSSSDELLNGIVQGSSSVVAGFLAAFHPVLIRSMNGKTIDWVRDKANMMLEDKFAAPPTCPGSLVMQPVNEGLVTSSEYSLAGILGLAALASFPLIGATALRCLRRTEGKPPTDAGNPASGDSWVAAGAGQLSYSLQKHQVHSATCVLVHLGLFAAVALIALSLFGLQASIGMAVQEAGETEHLANTLELNMWFILGLIKSWGFMWVTALLFVFIVVIPPVKFMLALACWHLAPTILSEHTRGFLLTQLAIGQKIEVISSFMVMFIIGCSQFNFASSDGRKFLIENAPRYAFFAPFGAYITGQVVLDAMLQAHHRSIQNDHVKVGLEKGSELELGTELMNNQDVLGISSAKSRLSQSAGWLSWLAITACVLGAPLFIIVGSYLNCFQTVWGGLLGLVRYEFEGTETVHFSVWTMMMKFPMPDGTLYDAQIVRCLTVVFLFALAWILVVGPVLQSIALLATWVTPLTSAKQGKLGHFATGLWRWTALDMFVLALGICSLLGEYLSRFMQRLFAESSSLTPICDQLGDVNLPCIRYHIKADFGLVVLFLGMGAQFVATFLIEHQLNKKVATA